MELSGRQLIEFRDLLMDSFSFSAMDELLMVSFDRRTLDDIAGPGLGREEAYLRLIRWMLDRGWIVRLIDAAKAKRPDKQPLQRFFSQVDIAPSDPAERTRLQSLVDAKLGVLDATTWILGLARRMGQICRIEAPQTGGGTGFLVGPDLVLTNHHVLAGVIPASQGGYGLDQLGAVRFTFENLLVGEGESKPTVAQLASESPWLVRCSPPQDTETKLPSPWTGTGKRLDYALVRLASRPGEEHGRGFMALPKLQAAAPVSSLHPNDPLLILQHPAGGKLKLALDTRAVIEFASQGIRVRYRTNTDSGSSGSPCFDLDWNVVALHQATNDAWWQGPAGVYNSGIPIGEIAAEIGSLVSAPPAPKPKTAAKPRKPVPKPGAAPKPPASPKAKAPKNRPPKGRKP
ncbi:MAG: trypsin-like peptidase domain-containing protein [Isosphaeraceae bacterium]